jgi:hypothetical protein
VPAPGLMLVGQGQCYRSDQQRDAFQALEVGIGVGPVQPRSTHLLLLLAGGGLGGSRSTGYRYENI